MLTKHKVPLYFSVLTVLSLLMYSPNIFSMGDAKCESTGSAVVIGGHGHGFIIAAGFQTPAYFSWPDRKPRRHHHERHEGGHHGHHEGHHEGHHHEGGHHEGGHHEGGHHEGGHHEGGHHQGGHHGHH